MTQSRPRAGGVSRRAFLQIAAGGGAALLAACRAPSGAAPAAEAPRPSGQSEEWDDLVRAAKAEGVVALNAGPGGDIRGALIDSFERAYPEINVEGTFASSNQMFSRILAERQAGKYLMDVLVGSATSALVALKPAGALAPLKPALMLPEVLDQSAWLENRLWWIDESEPYVSLMFQGNAEGLISYNTQMVDPRQFTSYQNLLDPRWKGQMASYDLREPGGGATQTRFIYRHPELGPAFLDRLYGDMDVALSADKRQLVDWVAQGRYPIGLLIGSRDVYEGIQQGLPLGMVHGDQIREGSAIGVGAGSVNLVDRAPHPNTAKLYLNWLLSRSGQMAWQASIGGNSLRVDIPKEGLFAPTVPKPGVKYLDVNTEEYARLSAGEISDVVSKALARRSD